jgi:hypothetical protein
LFGRGRIEDMMELATCRYIDFPDVGVVPEVATEWMFVEPTIMETIASVSKALHEYERARRRFLRGPRLVRSRLQMRPRHRRPVRGGKHPSPNRLRLTKLRPLSQRSARRRLLSM